MKTIVLYASVYGHAKRYAEWIAGELGADLVKLSELKDSSLSGYEAVVFGSGVYVGTATGAKRFEALVPNLSGKRAVVFLVGMEAQKEGLEAHALIKKNIPSLPDSAGCFHFQGGVDFPALGFKHRMMMKMMKSVLAKKEDQTDSDRLILDAYGKNLDLCNRADIAPLVAFLRK